MTYVVDYSGDHAFLDGVETASYVQPDGTTSGGSTIKVRRGVLGTAELSNPILGLNPGDVPFAIWLSTLDTGTIEPEGVLTVGGVDWTVLQMTERADNVQVVAICRKRV